MAGLFQPRKQLSVTAQAGPFGAATPELGRADLPELKVLAVVGTRTGTPVQELRPAESAALLDWVTSEGWEDELDQVWERVVAPAAPEQGLLRFEQSVALSVVAPSAALRASLPAAARDEFQRLHDSVLLAAERHGWRAFLFSGVSFGDGTSFVTRHVSRMLAASGYLRVARVEVLPPNAGIAPREDLFALRETDLPNLCEVSLTHGTHEAATQALSLSLRAVMDRLREHFNFILIDAPAVTAHAESVRFGALADAVTLVAREGATPHRLIEAAYDLFVEADANLIGIVLNRCAARPDAGAEACAGLGSGPGRLRAA
jgi:hypothetical protein